MNIEKLREKMYSKNISAKMLSEMTGIKYTTLINKLNNRADFTISEVISVVNALVLSEHETWVIFFNEKVA